MSFDLVNIWAHMSPLNKAIAGLLLIMAVASIAVLIERWVAFARGSKESRQFAKVAAPILEKWEVEKLISEANKLKHSPLARLFSHTADRYLAGYEDLDGGMTPVERARNEAERRKEAIGAELRRGMNILASVGSVAPFVGLLGTVIGIIAAFQGIAATGSGGLGAVSAGIAEALVETALGLMVAIPAVLFYNYLSARVNSIELALARSASELIDEMENQYGRKPEKRIEQAA